MDNFSDIAVFVEIVRKGSFTAAAESLKMSRPVVSKYLARLENRLGVRLLNRTTRKLSLTEAGQGFFNTCKSGLEQLQDAEAEVLQLQQSPKGILRLNTPMSFGIQHVAPLLNNFKESYPDIQVEMNLEDRKLDVVEEGFDVSVRITDMPDSSLVARRLCSCRHVIVAAPEYLESAGVPEKPGDLINHHILAYRYQESSHVWHFNGGENRQVQVSLPVHTKINNSLAIREAVLNGMGVARMPTFVVGQDIRVGNLVALFPKFDLLEVGVFLVYPQRRLLSPKVRAFIDFMVNQISDPPHWDEY